MDPAGRDQRSVTDQRNQRDHQEQSNRLHLNFGYGEQNLAADMGRAFPTTPSTFPQPMFPNQYGQRETWGTQQPAQSAYGNAGYFMNNPYQVQAQSQPQQQSQSPPPPQSSTQYQTFPNLPNPAGLRSPTNYNDATNGLVHQLSNQHLGGNATPRSESPFARQASPSARARPAAPQGFQQYGNHLSPQGPGHQNGLGLVDDELPIKNPEKYSENIFKRTKVATESVGTFFKENVQRARDRNQRYACCFDSVFSYG